MYIQTRENVGQISGIAIATQPPKPFPAQQPVARAAVPTTTYQRLTRVPVTKEPPWQITICRIVARSPGTSNFSVGTGLLVSPYHVLTCAHVIYPPQAPKTSEIFVYQGQNGADNSARRFKANGWIVSPRWRASNCKTFDEDYGIIRLPEKHGYMPLIPFDRADLLNQWVNMAGYPSTAGDPSARHLYYSRGRVLGEIHIRSCTLQNAVGNVMRNISETAKLIAHNLDSLPSLSGAPMWFIKDTRRPFAIHAGTIDGGRKGKAIILNDAVRAQLRDWMEQTLKPIP